MKSAHFGIVNDLVARLVYAVTEVDIFSIKEIGFVPHADLTEKFGGHHQVRSGGDGDLVDPVETSISQMVTVEESRFGEETGQARKLGDGRPRGREATMVIVINTAVLEI